METAEQFILEVVASGGVIRVVVRRRRLAIGDLTTRASQVFILGETVPETVY